MSDTGSYGDLIGRRRFLKLAGVSGAAALTFGSGAVGGRSLPPYGVHVSMTNTEPPQISWNMHNPSGQAQISHYAIHDSLAKFNYARGEFTPYLISDWQFASDTSSLELTVRDGAVWSNGDAVTAADVKRQLDLGLLVGESYSDYVDTVTTPDDSTVTVNFASDVNPEIVKFDLFENTVLFAHEDNYQEYLEESDETVASSNYLAFKDQNPIGSGLFSFESSDINAVNLVPNEDHPDYDEELVNYDYKFDFAGTNNDIHRRLLNNEYDSAFSVFTPPRIVADFPDSVEEVTIPAKFGFGLVPNHDHEHLGDRAVRQAIAYVIDRSVTVQIAGPRSKQPCPKPMGIPSDDQEAALGDAYADFNSYGPNDGEMDTASASAVLEDAGYTTGDTVTDSSGSTVSFDLTVPQGWSDWVTAAETVISQLNSFGFDVSLDSQPFGIIIDTLWPNGDFDLVAGSWLPGGGKASFPYFSLRYQMVSASWGWSYNYPAANSDRGGSNRDVTVPSRTGSGTVTVNPASRLETLSRTSDQATADDIIVEQAWVTNQDLPIIPVGEKFEQTFLTEDDYGIPNDVDNVEVANVKWANTWLPRQGKMPYGSEQGGSVPSTRTETTTATPTETATATATETATPPGDGGAGTPNCTEPSSSSDTPEDSGGSSIGVGPGFGVASGLAGLGGAAALFRQRLGSPSAGAEETEATAATNENADGESDS